MVHPVHHRAVGPCRWSAAAVTLFIVSSFSRKAGVCADCYILWACFSGCWGMSKQGNLRPSPSSWVPEEPGADGARLRNSAAEGDALAGEAAVPWLALGTSGHGAQHDVKIPDPAWTSLLQVLSSSATSRWPRAQADQQGLLASAAPVLGAPAVCLLCPVLRYVLRFLALAELICSLFRVPQTSCFLSGKK